jgi:hypothetical protein
MELDCGQCYIQICLVIEIGQGQRTRAFRLLPTTSQQANGKLHEITEDLARTGDISSLGSLEDQQGLCGWTRLTRVRALMRTAPCEPCSPPGCVVVLAAQAI